MTTPEKEKPARPPEPGTSPYRPPGPERVTAEQERATHRPPVSNPIDQESGVSWEELRKGLPPERPQNPDETIWDERYASQRQTYDLPEGSWDSADTGEAADYAQDRADQLGPG